MSESDIRKNIQRRLARIHNLELLKAIETMLEEFNYDEKFEMSELEKRAVDEGLKSIDQGEVYSHEAVVEQLQEKYPNLKIK